MTVTLQCIQSAPCRFNTAHHRGVTYLRALRTHADEIGGCIIFVLRMGFTDDTSGAVEEVAGLLNGRDIALSEGRSATGTVEHVALRPRIDSV